MQLNRRTSDISTSVLLAFNSQARALAASGRDVINMTVGEPDFDAPAAVQEAAVAAVGSGRVRYTPAAGTVELREIIAGHLTETRGVPFEAAEITVCHSAKHALSGTILSLVEPGDEVLLLRPAWVSYFEQIRYAGGVPVEVRGRPDHGPDFAALRAALGPRTRGLMLNTPSNPSGYVWSREEMAELAALAAEADLWILSDEIYRRLVYEGEPNPSPVSLDPEARARTVVVDGASKAFAMTGYRIGYAAARPEIAAGIARLHSHLTGSPNAISQMAFAAALREEPAEVERMVQAFDERRRFLVGALREMGLETPLPRGAFYALPDVSPWLDERGSAGFCEDLLEAEHLAIVPGGVFGIDTHVRLSYVLELPRIEQAVERLGRFLAGRPRRD